MDRALARASHQSPFDSAMLIAKRYLEVKHVLAVALKTKMPRLDNSRVHGPTATS